MAQEAQPITYKRSIKNILINKPLQREFTLVMISVMIGAGFLVGFLIHHTLTKLVDEAPHAITKSVFEQMITDARIDLLSGSVLIIFAAVIVTGLFAITFLHRVAGPVYRFGRVLKRMSEGEIPHEIKLRSRDFFKETAEDINSVIRYLREKKDS